ncbi:unnamed protein product [Brassica oleracea]
MTTKRKRAGKAIDDGVPGEPVACGTEVDFGDLNRLVGVITQGVTGTVAEKEVGKATEGGAATKDTDGQSMEADGNAMERGNLMEGPNERAKWTRQRGATGGKPIVDCSVVEEDLVNVPIAEEVCTYVKEAKGGGEKGPIIDSLVAEKAVENCPNAEQQDVALTKQAVVDEETVGEGATSEGEGCDSDGNGDKQLMELSDSSPCQRSEKHKPVEREADLAALLLAKEPFTMEKLVPTVEDTYFRFFQECVGWESERVASKCWQI